MNEISDKNKYIETKINREMNMGLSIYEKKKLEEIKKWKKEYIYL